jgi:RND family efflux transporter MFP subunit
VLGKAASPKEMATLREAQALSQIPNLSYNRHMTRLEILAFRLAAYLTGGLLLAGCGPKETPHQASPAVSAPAATVRLQKVERRKSQNFEEVVGTVRAKLRATLEAKVSGRIDELPVRLGQKVEAGQLIARLEAAEIRARLDQAEAALQQAEREWKRVKSLFEQQASARAEYDAADARYSMAKAAVAEARAMLTYIEVRAPFQGVVTRKWADVGDLAAPGKPLVELEDPTALQLDADVPEALASRIQLGTQMGISASEDGEELVGTVSEIAPAVDPASRTFRVKLDLKPGANARSGQFARLRVPRGETDGLQVPASAVVRRGQMEIIFVAENGIARLRLVRTGRPIGKDVEVVSGLEEGESVVTEGAARLIDGQPLNVQ